MCESVCACVKLMSGILSLERSEQILATNIVYLFTSFLGSDVNVETRCIVYRVNIHILICTLNVRETKVIHGIMVPSFFCISKVFVWKCV